MKTLYVAKKFGPEALGVIAQAEAICEEYAAQGFDLTLRQLYYQFVSRDLIRNRQSEYKRLGSIVNDARMAGLLDWDYIVDRTRNLEELGHFASPGAIIETASRAYHRDLWADQPVRIEVWIEKDALTGVIAPTCRGLDIAYFSCRGYSSQSEMHAAGQRLGAYIEAGQRVVILHLGDHDPSGLDMSRDIEERLDTFLTQDYVNDHADDVERNDKGHFYVSAIRRSMATRTASEDAFELRRIALTMAQVEEYAPPPNPAKTTDSRFADYAVTYGHESWELDALEPTVLAGLIEDAVEELVDADIMEAAIDRQETERARVQSVSERWDDVVALLEEDPTR